MNKKGAKVGRHEIAELLKKIQHAWPTVGFSPDAVTTWVDGLGKFTPADLDRAWRTIRDSAGDRPPPKLGQFIALCRASPNAWTPPPKAPHASRSKCAVKQRMDEFEALLAEYKRDPEGVRPVLQNMADAHKIEAAWPDQIDWWRDNYGLRVPLSRREAQPEMPL